MVEILIRGGDAERAAQAMRSAIREIFEFDPLATPVHARHTPGTRSGLELAVMIALGLTPAIQAARELHGAFAEHLRRLATKAEEQRKETGATLLIDFGDGKPIPLDQANRDAVLQALRELEQRRKT